MSAFNYRTSSELLLPLFPKERISLISNNASDRFKDKETHLGPFFSFAMKDSEKKYLSEKGIYLSPFSGEPHSHPVCKTIENHIIYVILPGLLNNLTSCVLSSIRLSKFKNVRSMVKQSCRLRAINRIIDPKDVLRYCNDTDMTSVVSSVDSFEAFQGCAPGENYFFFDEVHYWGSHNMISFLEKKRPSVVICSVVFPIEILFDYRYSANPGVYDFKLTEDGFDFYPDGIVSEAYSQPSNMRWLFRSNKIILNDGSSYSVTLLKTIAAHHVFVLTQVGGATEKRRTFNDFDILDLGILLKLNYRHAVQGVRLSLFKKIVTYLSCLKNPDHQSAVAKMRQLCGDDVNLKEMLFFRDFADKYSHSGVSALSGGGLIKNFFDGFFDSLPVSMQRCFQKFTRDTLLEAIIGAKQVSFSFDLKAFREGDDCSFFYRELPFFLSGNSDAPEPLLIISNNNDWGSSTHTLSDRADLVRTPGTPCRYPSMMVDQVLYCANRQSIAAGISTVGVLAARLVSEIARSFSGVYVVYSGYDWCANPFDDEGAVLSFPPLLQLTSGFESSPVVASMSHALDWVSSGEGAEDLSDAEISSDASESPSELPAISLQNGGEGDYYINFAKSSVDSILLRCKVNDEISEALLGFISSLDFSKGSLLRGRSALFFSDNFHYGHDKVRYATFTMPKILQAIIKDSGLDSNTVLVQRFNEGGSIPFHADDESCYSKDLEVYCINIGSAILRWKERGFDKQESSVELRGTLGYTMPSGFQKRFLHSVSTLNEGVRYSLTFRRQDRTCFKSTIFPAESVLRVLEKGTERKNDCFITAAAKACGRSVTLFKNLIEDLGGNLIERVNEDSGLSLEECKEIASGLRLFFKVVSVTDSGEEHFNIGSNKCRHQTKTLILRDDHFECSEMVGFRPDADETSSVSSLDGCNPLDTALSSILGVSRVTFAPTESHARSLASSFQIGATGVCSDETFSSSNLLNLNYKGATKGYELFTLYGFAGSGKSSPVQKLISKSTFGRVLVVSPRKNLLDDWVQKCGENKKNTFKTFELALRLYFKNYKLIVLDEASLFPKGYLDLVCTKLFTDKSAARLLIIGDPLQAEYYSKEDSVILDQTAVNLPISSQSTYLGYSYRNGSWLEKAVSDVSVEAIRGKKKGSMTTGDSCEVVQCVNHDDVLLVASFALKTFFIHVAGVKRVLTYGESQGLTFKKTVIVLSQETRMVDDGRIMVAFTRSQARPAVYFHDSDISVFRELAKSRVLRAFLFSETLNLDDLVSMRIIREGHSIGGKKNRERVKEKKRAVEVKLNTVEQRAAGDPWLKAMLPLFHFPERPNELPMEVDVVEPSSKCHLPLVPANFAYIASTQSDPRGLRKDILSPFCCSSKQEGLVRKSDEDRENTGTGIRTMQFDRLNVGGRNITNNAADRFESIYPVHSGDDTATFVMAVRKRLRFSDPIAEAIELEESWSKSYVLYENLKSKMLGNLDTTFDQGLFDECEQEFVEKKMGKNIATLAAHAERSDPDWPTDFAKIFMKSQHCTKLDNAMMDAKAGQTLACFSHAVLVRFGVWCRYLEKKLVNCLPSNIYLHSRRNFNVFDAWVREHKKNDFVSCVESDYSAFDRSQDAVSLGIELMLMEDLLVPRVVIEEYKSMKTTLGSNLGNFAIMRFTGEFSTFLFNTVSNMAFSCLLYKDIEKEPVCFAGDDMCCLADLEVDEGAVNWMNDLRLTAKVFRNCIPTFCGWCLSSKGIFKHPELLLFRVHCAIEKGKILDCLDSYAIEFSYAYHLGDQVLYLMDETCLSAHQETASLFMRYRHKMQVNTRLLLDWVNGKSEKKRGEHLMAL